MCKRYRLQLVTRPTERHLGKLRAELAAVSNTRGTSPLLPPFFLPSAPSRNFFALEKRTVVQILLSLNFIFTYRLKPYDMFAFVMYICIRLLLTIILSIWSLFLSSCRRACSLIFANPFSLAFLLGLPAFFFSTFTHTHKHKHTHMHSLTFSLSHSPHPRLGH